MENVQSIEYRFKALGADRLTDLIVISLSMLGVLAHTEDRSTGIRLRMETGHFETLHAASEALMSITDTFDPDIAATLPKLINDAFFLSGRQDQVESDEAWIEPDQVVDLFVRCLQSVQTLLEFTRPDPENEPIDKSEGISWYRVYSGIRALRSDLDSYLDDNQKET